VEAPNTTEAGVGVKLIELEGRGNVVLLVEVVIGQLSAKLNDLLKDMNLKLESLIEKQTIHSTS
jgi:hypothetical protein